MECKKPSPPKSAAIIGSNDDLLLQTLQFLPTKSLIRFTSVSKRFQSLISDPSFGHLHTLRHRPKPQPSFILHSVESQFFYCDPTAKRLIPIHFKLDNMKLVQSRNGLLLLENISSRNTPKDLYIYNPATMESRELVISDEETRHFDGVSLVFDPSKSPHYKVVCFGKGSNLGSNKYTVVKMYNSETHTWEQYGDHCITDEQLWDDIYCNYDDIYFMRSDLKSFSFYHQASDMWIDTSRVMSFGPMKCHKMESNGRLYGLYVTFERSWNSISEPWLINDDCGSSEMFKAAYNHHGTSFCVLGMIVRGDEEEGTMLLFHVPGKIVIYRFYEDDFEVLVDFTSENYYKEGKLLFGFEDAHQFIETLAPV